MITVHNLREHVGATVSRLMAEPNKQFAQSRKLEKAIRSNLEVLGYGQE